MFVKKPQRLEALAYVVLLAAMVRAIIQRRARRYAEIKNEELPIPGKRMTKRPTARMILDSFDAIVVVILSDGSRMLSESRLFPHKMFRALGVSPSVYVTIPRETWDPQNSADQCTRVLKMGQDHVLNPAFEAVLNHS